MTTEHERLTRLHGALVMRVVDRLRKFRHERVQYWIDNRPKLPKEEELPDHLDQYAEATALVAIVQAHKGLTEVLQYRGEVNGDDMGSYQRVYEFATVGHTLTENDVRDIEATLAEYNDEIGNQADKAMVIRMQAIRDIGGDELVDAMSKYDEARSKASVQRALAKYREAVDKLDSGETSS